MTVVLIDDNQEHLSLRELSIIRAFESEPHSITVRAYSTPSEAFSEISDTPNQVVLIDYQLQGSTGVDWIVDFINAGVGPVILITSSGDEKIAVNAFREGAFDYLVKSDAIQSPIIIQRSILESLRRYKLEQTNLVLSKRLKLTNKDLNSKNLKLTDLTETAHRFVEDVAHEFRTPFTVIKEFASILADGLGGDVTPKQLQYLNYITASTSDLAGLIDDFLNSSRMRTNSMRVNHEELCIKHVIDGVRPMLQTKAATKSINLIFEAEENLPKIYIDSDKLQRSIINLVVNAIKFSESNGDVRVSAKRFNEHFVIVSVEDNGPGLPAGTVNDLFDRFNRGKSGHNKLENGFGLGLSIVKELVSINLGEVQIKSTLGEGSTFSFTVPCSNFESIIKGVFSQSSKLAEKPKISMLAIHRESDDQSLEDLTSQLNTLSYPMDVVLHPEGSPNVYAIGITDDPDGYRRRIEIADAEVQLSGEISFSPLVVHRCGSWNISQAESSLTHYLQNTHTKETLRA